MEAWASAAAGYGLPAVFFTSLEHVFRLRHADDRAYEQFLIGARQLVEAGMELQPHNHCAFNVDTGQALRTGDLPERVSNYDKRPSMFFDVVYRNGIPISEWIPRVTSSFAAFGREVGQSAGPLAFRPGGWDSGGDSRDLADYVEALGLAGVRYDSSATRGEFGSTSWKVGLPFGRNVFRLKHDIIEVAATMGLNCGHTQFLRVQIEAVLRLARQRKMFGRPWPSGVLSPVLHFDHLVDVSDSAAAAARRAQRTVGLLAQLASRLNLTPQTFQDLRIIDDATPLPAP
jgi:hypothetical protein